MTRCWLLAGLIALAEPPMAVHELWRGPGTPPRQFKVLLFPASEASEGEHRPGESVPIRRALLVEAHQADDSLFTLTQDDVTIRARSNAFDIDVDPGLMQGYIDRLNEELTGDGWHAVRAQRDIDGETVRFELSVEDPDGRRNWFVYAIDESGPVMMSWRAERAPSPRRFEAWMLGGVCAAPVVVGVGLIGFLLWRRTRLGSL